MYRTNAKPRARSIRMSWWRQNWKTCVPLGVFVALFVAQAWVDETWLIHVYTVGAFTQLVVVLWLNWDWVR